VQETIPDISSEHAKETVTAALFQPSVFGAGVALPPIVGAVASLFIVTDWELDPPALVAAHVSVVPAVSVLIVVGPQALEDVIEDSASVTIQLTVTSLVYHPLLPRDSATFGVITGAVVSRGGGVLTMRVNFAGLVL
jgi:hypothetical protein